MSLSEPQGSPPRRVGRYLLLAAVVVFFLTTFRSGHDWNGDFAHYVHHAKNIAEGRSYSATGYIYNPLNPAKGPRAYPPGFPVSIALTYRAFGLNLTAYKVQLVLVFVASLAVTASLFARTLKEPAVLVYVIAIGFCPVFWRLKDSILSEHLFMLLWYTAILAADRCYQQESLRDVSWRRAALLGLLVYLTYSVRTIGIVLLPAVVLTELAVAKRLTRFGVTAVATAAGLIVLEKLLLPSAGQGYLEQLRFLSWQSVRENLSDNGWAFVAMWRNGYSENVSDDVGRLLSLVAVVGWGREFLRKPPFLAIAVLGYLGLAVVWPSASGVRMIAPLLPAYLYFLLSGIKTLAPRPWIERTGVALLLAFTVASYAGWYRQADYGPLEGVESPTTVELFQFVREHTTDEDVCLFFKPRVLALYTGRRATAYPREGEEDSLWPYLKSVGVTVVIVNTHPRDRDAEFLLSRDPRGLVEVWRNDAFRVYRLANATRPAL